MEFSISRGPEEAIEERHFDVVIIGAGAAGFSAAVYSVRSGLTAVILDKSIPGGLTAEAPLVENYLGFKKIPGSDLAREFSKHASEYASIISDTEVQSVRKENDEIRVSTSKGDFFGKNLVIGTGSTHKKLGIPGEDEYFGKGLSYCSTCDGFLFKDKNVVVIGGGNSGAIAAITMNEYTKQMTIIEFMPKFMCEDAYTATIKKNKIPYLINSQVLEILGDGKKLTGVRYKDRETEEVKEIKTDGVFIYVGLKPQTDFLKGSGIELSDRGYIVVDRKGRTNISGIYAAGDVVKDNEAQIATAVGDGCRAAITLYSDMIKAGRR